MNRITKVLSLGTIALALGACATNKAVDEKIAAAQAATNTKIESVSSQVEAVQQHQKDQDTQLGNLSQEAKDALDRATQAGILAKGKVAFEQTLTDESVKFKSGKHALSDDSKKALDDFAGKVKALTDPYYIEIQGHTDDRGDAQYNEDLGQRRADEVRRYLSSQYKLPLARMSTISYGETLPAAPNTTKAGRAQNRRVVLVVLQ